jgi:hypothetical protein
MPVLSSEERRAALVTLGLEPGASLDQITSAYRRLAKATHPDVNTTAGTDRDTSFAAINLAYRLLSDRSSGPVAVQPQPEPQPRPQPRPTRVPRLVPTFGVPPRQGWSDRPLVVAGPVTFTPARPTQTSRPPQPTEVSQPTHTTRSARHTAPEQGQ